MKAGDSAPELVSHRNLSRQSSPSHSVPCGEVGNARGRKKMRGRIQFVVKEYHTYRFVCFGGVICFRGGEYVANSSSSSTCVTYVCVCPSVKGVATYDANMGLVWECWFIRSRSIARELDKQKRHTYMAEKKGRRCVVNELCLSSTGARLDLHRVLCMRKTGYRGNGIRTRYHTPVCRVHAKKRRTTRYDTQCSGTPPPFPFRFFWR